MVSAPKPQFLDYLTEYQPFETKTVHSVPESPIFRENTEGWPPLLTKKFLACYFGCWSESRQTILTKRFRSKVLTPEVLQRAGISLEYAYSRSCKEFDAVESIKLTQILLG